MSVSNNMFPGAPQSAFDGPHGVVHLLMVSNFLGLHPKSPVNLGQPDKTGQKYVDGHLEVVKNPFGG